MRTIKGTKGTGVPLGTRCERNSVGVLITEGKNKDSHKNPLKARVILRCLVAVKT